MSLEVSYGLRSSSVLGQQPLRVLQIINDVGMGGGEHYVLRLAELLKKRQIAVACTCKLGEPFHINLKRAGICEFPINLSPSINPIKALKILRFARSHRIQLIHAHGVSGAFYARIVAFLSEIPLITTYHIAITSITDIPKWKKFLYTVADRLMSSIDKQIVVVSRALKRQLVQIAKFKNSKIQVLYTGIDADAYGLIDRHTARNRLNLKPTDHVIGYIGRMSHEKGVHTLLEALQILAKKQKKITAIIAGDGPFRETLIKQATDKGLLKICLFLGQRQDIPDILPALDLLTIPSLTEGLPQILLEAMASSVPVIASNVGGIPEVVQNGITGIIVSPENPATLARAMDRMLFDKAMAKQMGEAGRWAVEQHFSAEQMVNGMVGIYKKSANCMNKCQI